MTKVKAQVGGNHYNTKYQHVDVMVANEFDYLDSQVMKYMWRHESKNGAEDIHKAVHYCLFNLKYKYNELDDDVIELIMEILTNTHDCSYEEITEQLIETRT